MAGRLTTHILDTSRGTPGAGVRIELWALDEQGDAPIVEVTSNADGRTDSPLLSGAAFRPGRYELRFHIGPYFAERDGPGGAVTGLYDVIPIRFILADPDGHYHIPLLASPWSYSTYRGS